MDGDEAGLSDTGRTEAFSDGVMAIAITLLILDVRVDDESGKGLLHDLLHIWPTYAAYLGSFLIIGIIWMNHHGFFRQVRALDRRMQWWNLMLLLAISWLPFPTALVAEQGHQPVTKVLYIGTMTVSSVLVGLMARRIRAVPAIRDSDDSSDPAASWVSALLFATALAVSLAVPATGYYPLFLLTLTGVLVRGRHRLRGGRPHAGRVGQ